MRKPKSKRTNLYLLTWDSKEFPDVEDATEIKRLFFFRAMDEAHASRIAKQQAKDLQRILKKRGAKLINFRLSAVALNHCQVRTGSLLAVLISLKKTR